MNTILTEPTRTIPEIDDGGSTDLDGWYCLEVDPWTCGCGQTQKYVVYGGARQPEHPIVCWPEKDDENLLTLAAHEQRTGCHPKIVEYEKSLGVAIDYYEIPEFQQ